MNKNFDVDSRVNFPEKTSCREINGYHVIIAPEYPNWIILDDHDYAIYQILSRYTIIDGLKKYYTAFPGNTEKDCIRAFTEFLTKIEARQFYKETPSVEEEPIEAIKKKVHISLTNNCNMRCPHCFVSAGKVPIHELNVDELLSVVQKIRNLNGDTDIVVSGGEPLIHPNVFKLLQGLRGNHVTLFTNGTLINQNNYKLIADCCEEIQISFEGVTQSAYEKIRGKGNYAKVLRAINLLKTTDIKISLAITILPLTFQDVRDHLIPFVKSINYKNLDIRLNDDIELAGNALSMDLTGFNKQEADKTIISLVGQLQDIGVSKKANIGRNIKFKNCGIGTNIVINADGKIYPCNKISSYFLKMDHDMRQLFEEFNELNRRTSTDFIEECKNCELRYICSGGCRIDHLNHSGNMLHINCTDKFKESQYKKLLFDYY